MRARDLPAVALLVAVVLGTLGLSLTLWILVVLPGTAVGWALYSWHVVDRRTRARVDLPHPHLPRL